MREPASTAPVRIERGKIWLWVLVPLVAANGLNLMRMAAASSQSTWLLPLLGVFLVAFGILAVWALRAAAIEISDGAITWIVYHPWRPRRIPLDEVTTPPGP